MSRLDEIAARLAAAPALIVYDEGAAGRGRAWSLRTVVPTKRIIARMTAYPGNGDDALLLAHAPDDLRDLLAVARAAAAWHRQITMFQGEPHPWQMAEQDLYNAIGVLVAE